MPTSAANSRALNPLSRHRATRFSQTSRLSRPMHHSDTAPPRPRHDVVRRTLTIYDDAGRVKVATDAFGGETHFVYDGFGRTIIVSDSVQRSVRQGYDTAVPVLWR